MMNFPDNINFAEEELKIIEFWSQIKAFETSLQQSLHKDKFSFYDGPPFATGLPHYGHLLAGSIKDIVTRYAHQTNHHVERRFGWDCHGVPIEYEIDKSLGITGPKDVEKMGIAAYNAACRSIVMKYSTEWREVVTRLGRWIDFDNDYKTMYPSFMESVWYIFKQIFEKGMVYRGVKVMPFSTKCSTPLSNFEAKQNFKDVNDPAVVVSFPLFEDPSTQLLAWTTTPWTLPSNLAICVNPELEYVKIKELKTSKKFILLENRIAYVFKKEAYEILDRFKGKSLENKKYIPLFNYFIHMDKEKYAFSVVCDGYVTSDSGTGLVHQAPYFGEDDFRICLMYGIIKKESEIICPVDECGKFTDEVVDFSGKYVKDADKDIIAYLKKHNRLISHGSEKHSYPFCWRSDTPLLYKAVPSWFIRVEDIIPELLKSNNDTYWVPDFVKENRFANWLKEARDWAISRNRYWGTPMPLWVSEDLEEVVCVGSIEELERLSGVKVHDLHREFIDDIIIPSKMNKGVLRRIPEVFDCWFESGCMPYAQVHFPFSAEITSFNEIFPADFIAEGVDQTRGWFYTLTVISTLLYGKSPFKNLIVNGIVLAEDGQKMSKRLRNYPDPSDIMKNYGADALRLYLINSPVVRAQNLKFQEAGVRDILKDVFLPWYNAFKFLFLSSILPYERMKNNGNPILFKSDIAPKSNNIMDLWIISFTQSLVKYFHEQMRGYRLDTVIPRLVKYIDHLTNYYVRMNRKRLKGEVVRSEQDWLNAIQTLFFVLYQTTVMLSPFVPFITELFYQKLRQRLDCRSQNVLKIGIDNDNRPESVHYVMIPSFKEELINSDIEESIALMQTVVELARKLRDQKTLPLRSSLAEVVVVAQKLEQIVRIKDVEAYVLEELNVRTLTISSDKRKYGIELRAELNHRALGIKLKKDYQNVLKASKDLSTQQLEEFQLTSQIDIFGHLLTKDDLEVIATVNKENKSLNTSYESISNAEGILVLLDCHQTSDLLKESTAREIINKIQRRRKELALVPEDPIEVVCWSESEYVRDILATHKEMINKVVLQPIVVCQRSFEDLRDAQCSILSDYEGVEYEIKCGDIDALLTLSFLHDHGRLKAHHRKCTHIVKTKTKEGHVLVTSEGGVSQHFDICSMKSYDVLLRHIRIFFGWTSFHQFPIILYEGDTPLSYVRDLSMLNRRRLIVKET